MKHNAFGCAVIVLGIAVLVAAGTALNLLQGSDDVERVSRMRAVRATIIDKGIATYRSSGSSRTPTPPRSLDSTSRPAATPENVTNEKWIRFECQVGETRKPGSAPRLFSDNEDAVWPKYEKGKEYDAYYDPVLDACYLNIDQDPIGVYGRARLGFGSAATLAAIAIVVILTSKRLGWNRDVS